LLAAPLGCFPEDDERRLLALPDLGPERLPLVVGRPLARRVAMLLGEQPEEEQIDSPVLSRAYDVQRCEAIGPGHVPRHAIGPGSALHRIGDLLCDSFVDVWCLLVHDALSFG